jgi:hypothetical protein
MLKKSGRFYSSASVHIAYKKIAMMSKITPMISPHQGFIAPYSKVPA